MIEPLTSNTQAILLLTAPLVAGRAESSPELLSLGEYNKLARILREKHKQPADLIGPDAPDLIAHCAQPFGVARMNELLGRGFLLSQAVERWSARAIWIVSRADSRYPKRLKTRLKEDAPPLLYGCGEIGLLEKGGLAVVGSRNVDDELIGFTEGVGKLAAKARLPIVSGGAKGIDRAAMRGALQEGGEVAGVMADSLERAALAGDNREPLLERRLVLISPYDPAAGFNVGHAMQRNKAIYALADAGLVVTSDFEKGGTWAGAIEQLERLHLIPVFVRDGEKAGRGNAALIHHGGRPWPNPENTAELTRALTAAREAAAAEPKQETLSFAMREEPPTPANPLKPVESAYVMEAPQVVSSPAGELFKTARELLLRGLGAGRTEPEIADLLGITKSQAREWLTELVKEGTVERISRTKPARYRPAITTNRLL